MKLREVSVGYTFDGPWVNRILGFSSIDMRLAGRNLLTWTKYTGIDPETSLLGSATSVRGIDYFNNPQSRSFVFSLTLNPLMISDLWRISAMTRASKISAVAVVALIAAGCSDYLTGPGIDKDPNNISQLHPAGSALHRDPGRAGGAVREPVSSKCDDVHAADLRKFPAADRVRSVYHRPGHHRSSTGPRCTGPIGRSTAGEGFSISTRCSSLPGRSMIRFTSASERCTRHW